MQCGKLRGLRDVNLDPLQSFWMFFEHPWNVCVFHRFSLSETGTRLHPVAWAWCALWIRNFEACTFDCCRLLCSNTCQIDSNCLMMQSTKLFRMTIDYGYTMLYNIIQLYAKIGEFSSIINYCFRYVWHTVLLRQQPWLKGRPYFGLFSFFDHQSPLFSKNLSARCVPFARSTFQHNFITAWLWNIQST